MKTGEPIVMSEEAGQRTRTHARVAHQQWLVAMLVIATTLLSALAVPPRSAAAACTGRNGWEVTWFGEIRYHIDSCRAERFIKAVKENKITDIISSVGSGYSGNRWGWKIGVLAEVLIMLQPNYLEADYNRGKRRGLYFVPIKCFQVPAVGFCVFRQK